MQDLLSIYKNAQNNLPANRIDGIYSGSIKMLIEKCILESNTGWKILIIGEVKITDLRLKEFIAISDKNGFYCEIRDEIKEKLISVLENSYIEVMYIFDDKNSPKIMIDDFPEDITISY